MYKKIESLSKESCHENYIQLDDFNQRKQTKYRFTEQNIENVDYWLGIIGYAVGYGSFWRFPYLIHMCG